MINKSYPFMLLVIITLLFRSCHLQLDGLDDKEINFDGRQSEREEDSNDTSSSSRDENDKGVCYGEPEPTSCVQDKNCDDFLISYKRMGKNTAWFDMMLLGPSSHFISLGLSKDRELGEDLFVECSKNNTVVHMSFYPDGKTRIKLPVKCDTIQTSRLANCTVESFKFKNKPYILCTFKWKSITVVDLNRFDMNKIGYYLHLGSGSKDLPQNGTSFEYKGNKIITTLATVHFNKTALHGKEKVLWIKLHGIISMLVFFVFIPNATFCARYLKETKTKKLILGRKMWYFIHIVLMIAGFLFFMLSMIFILVYTYKNDLRWPSTPAGKQHAVIGAVTGIIFTSLIAFSWLRPASSDNKRIVGIFHFIFGVVTLILGLKNIMDSYNMSEANMPCAILFFGLIWTVWTFFWILIMGLHFWWLGRLINVSTSRAFVPLTLQPVVNFDAPGGKQRLNIFLYYACGTIILTLITIIVYGASATPCSWRKKQ